MKKASMKQRSDDLRLEYDLASLKGVARGKYYRRAMAGTNLILLEPDVARAFPDSDSVNRALRLLRDVAKRSSGRTRRAVNGRRRAAG
jgi:hypothetical protein